MIKHRELCLAVGLALVPSLLHFQRPSCPPRAEPAHAEIPSGICEDIHNSHSCARAIEGYLRWRGEHPILRDTVGSGRSRLRVPLASGDTLALIDTPRAADITDIAAYSYLNYYPSIDSHLIQVQRYEWVDYQLIHRCSGERAGLQAPPTISPNHQRFVTVSAGRRSEIEGPNEIQIWRVTADGYERDWTIDPGWGPKSAEWLSPTEIRVDTWAPEPTWQEFDDGFAILRLTADGWSFDTAPAVEPAVGSETEQDVITVTATSVVTRPPERVLLLIGVESFEHEA